MEQFLYDLHLTAGRIAGPERTCGKKQKFATETAAVKAAGHHNKWEGRRHDVEPYPCFFCEQWHIGGEIPVEVLNQICATK